MEEKILLWRAFALMCVILNVRASASVPRPIVELQEGKIRGTTINSWHGQPIYAFYGIPYAAPPTSKLRFKAPRPVEPWKKVLNCTVDRPSCYFYNPFTERGEGNEDCLYLNVFTKKLPSADQNLKYDVLVFIPGGGFMYGVPPCNGPEYIFDSEADNIVFVQLKYRVGPLGFLSTGDDISSGNNGLKDQVAALQWVQKNIAAFGGNPNSVTLFGQSAGGSSVHYHFLSKMSDGLFHRGFSLSGATLNPWAFSEKNVEKTRGLAASLSCPTKNSVKMVSCLQGKPAESIALYSAQLQGWQGQPFSPWGPSVEVNSSKPFLDEDPYRLLEQGKVKDLPWVVSFTSDEGLYPVGLFEDNKNNALSELDEKWNETAPYLLDFVNTIPKAYQATISSDVRKYYFGNQPISMDTFKNLVQAVSERLYLFGIVQSARLQAAANTSPVYLLHFAAHTKKSSVPGYKGKEKQDGVAHGEDLAYILHAPSFGEILDFEEGSSLSRLLINMWLSFAKTGTPTVGNATWVPVSKDSKRVGDIDFLEIRGHNDVKALKKPSLSNYEFWTSLDYSSY